MVLGGNPRAPRRRRPALGRRAALPQRRRSRRPASPPASWTTPPPACAGSPTSSPPARRRLEAGEIILAGSFTRPHVGLPGRHRARRLRTAGEHHMPLRLNPTTFRDALRRRRCRPAAGRDVGLLRQPAGRRDLRRVRPGLAADRHGALPQRPGIRPRPAAGRRRLPGHARSSGVPVGDTVLDQAGTSTSARRTSCPDGDSAAEAEAAVAAARYPPRGRPRRRLGARPLGALEPRRRTTSPAPTSTRRVTVQIETADGVAAAADIAGGRRRRRRLRRALRPRRVHGRCSGSRNTPRSRRRRTLPSPPPRGRQARRRERLRPGNGPRATSPPAPPSCWSGPTWPSWPAAPRPLPPTTSHRMRWLSPAAPPPATEGPPH